MLTARQGLLDRMLFRSQSKSASKKEPSKKILIKPGFFQWPLEKMYITSGFGRRGERFHYGIDLRAAEGTPVYPIQSGIVIYADSILKGYGKMIVIRHNARFSSVYAHNSKLYVQYRDCIDIKKDKNKTVIIKNKKQKIEKIAETGKTGYATGPHLHFEIRDGLEAVDPLVYYTKKQKTLLQKKAK